MKQLLIDGITEEMEKLTQAKFTAWDRVVKDNILEKGTEEEKMAVYTMLQDPTIYAYAFFKNPNDLDKPFKLYSYQDLIINDTHKRVMFVAANQIGKSITLCIKALVFALNHPGKTVLMTSKGLTQSKDLVRQIKNFLRNSRLDYLYDIGDTETKTEIYLKHYYMEDGV